MDDFANPLPPPPKPEFKAPAPRLANADFRKLLETPRVRPGEAGGDGSIGGAGGAGRGRGAGSQPKKKREWRQKPAAKEEGAEEDGSAYRDRADERRKGLNPDYERVTNDLAAIVAGGGGAAEMTAISVEDSKFLGGDLEHTHLVKGLDYALLQKVRGELTKEEQEEQEAEKQRAKAKARAEMKFVTSMGRAVYDHIFNPPRSDVRDWFQPRRTAFVYELEDEDGRDIPTTLRRSKADCPPVVDTTMGVADAAVLERLAKIMSYMTTAVGKPGKKKKKDRLMALGGLGLNGGARLKGMPAHGIGLANGGSGNGNASPQPPLPADDGDDIFEDAGRDYEYVPGDKPAIGDGAANGAAIAATVKKEPGADAGDDVDMELDDAPPPPPPPPSVPPPPPAAGPAAPGPALPPSDYDYENAYASAYEEPSWQEQHPSYEAFVQAGVAYQAASDPEYQALLAKQAALREAGDEEDAALDAALERAAAGHRAGAGGQGGEAGGLTAEEKRAGLGSVFKRDDEGLAQRREADAREKDPAFVSDAYAECYPGYHEFGTAVVDSDEEDLTHMDSKEKGQSRYDFATEEEWQQYKSSKESLPKAAFQFGLKMADGRKPQKTMGGKARPDHKIDSQLQKIQSILDKKGSEYGKAFDPDAPAREPELELRPKSKRKRI